MSESFHDDWVGVEEIVCDGEMLAILVRNSFNKEGINFFTPDSAEQQLGYMNYRAGHSIEPHRHRKVQRTIQHTTEVLFVKKGKIRANFFKNNNEYYLSRILAPGDILVLISGGHGFDILEDSEMYEVKQGPYVPALDKERFQILVNGD